MMVETDKIRVLIADDEESIGLLIQHLIKWEDLGMEVVKVVQNGFQAIEVLKKDTIDIVITDIRMPGMDGLSMVQEIKKISKETQYIVVSGYKDFEYAKTAIKYGVVDYVLKPVSKIELQTSLEKIAKTIHLKRSIEKQEEERNEILDENAKKIRKHFIDAISNHTKFAENMTIESVNKEYYMQFQDGCFQMACVKVDIANLDNNEATIYVYNILVSHLNIALKDICNDYEILWNKQKYFILMNYAEKDTKEIEKRLRNIVKNLLWTKDIIENMKLTLGLGIEVTNISALGYTSKSAQLAICDRIIKGTNQLIMGVIPNEAVDVNNEIPLSDFGTSIVQAVNEMKVDKILECLKWYENSIVEKENIKGYHIIQLVKGLVNVYILEMQGHGMAVNQEQTLFESMTNNIENIGTFEEIFIYISHEITIQFKKAVEEKMAEEYYPIKHAKKYIEQNYSQNISLKEVAEIIGYNATYFSSLFKKETGETFNEYLVKRRLEVAKELLRTTSDKIETIALTVGYNDVKHFNKIFKKDTTLKPSEYRKIFSKMRSTL